MREYKFIKYTFEDFCSKLNISKEEFDKRCKPYDGWLNCWEELSKLYNPRWLAINISFFYIERFESKSSHPYHIGYNGVWGKYSNQLPKDLIYIVDLFRSRYHGHVCINNQFYSRLHKYDNYLKFGDRLVAPRDSLGNRLKPTPIGYIEESYVSYTQLEFDFMKELPKINQEYVPYYKHLFSTYGINRKLNGIIFRKFNSLWIVYLLYNDGYGIVYLGKRYYYDTIMKYSVRNMFRLRLWLNYNGFYTFGDRNGKYLREFISNYNSDILITESGVTNISDPMKYIRAKYAQLVFPFYNDEFYNIKVTIDINKLIFNFCGATYLINSNRTINKVARNLGYFIPVVLNGKKFKVKSLTEFEILCHLVDKYGKDNVVYGDRIPIDDIVPDRREIQPDFYIKSLNKYIEYHNDKTDGKYDLYMEVAKAKNLNIEWWTDYEYCENKVTSKVPRYIALSDGFEYNFDNDIYVVKSSEGYYTVTKLIDLINSLNIELPKCIKDNYIICK